MSSPRHAVGHCGTRPTWRIHPGLVRCLAFPGIAQRLTGTWMVIARLTRTRKVRAGVRSRPKGCRAGVAVADEPPGLHCYRPRANPSTNQRADERERVEKRVGAWSRGLRAFACLSVCIEQAVRVQRPRDRVKHARVSIPGLGRRQASGRVVRRDRPRCRVGCSGRGRGSHGREGGG